MKGTIRAIPVTEPKENMQVILDGRIIKLGNLIVLSKEEDGAKIILNDLSQLVVEHTYSDQSQHGDLSTEQVPLKYSQWQKCLDENLIDKEVEFEILEVTDLQFVCELDKVMPKLDKQEFKIAQLIPQEQKLYTAESCLLFAEHIGSFNSLEYFNGIKEWVDGATEKRYTTKQLFEDWEQK